MTLSFWVSIVTSESSGATSPYDKLAVQLVDASTGTLLSTLTTLSNLDPTGSATIRMSRPI